MNAEAVALIDRLTHRVSQRPTRTARILSYLARQPQPRHYTVIAQRLREDAARTQKSCERLAHQGKLRWCGPGLYVLIREAARG